MRKPLAALLLLLSFAYFADAQTRNVREKAGLFGPVKSVRLETSKIRERDGEQVESPRALESITRYDEMGNEIDQSIYFNGVLQGKIISVYDAQGNFTQTHYNAEGAVTARSIVKYDGAGKVTELSTYNANGSLTRKVTYVRNDLGKLTEEIAVDYVRPALSYRIVHFYDEAGKPTMDRVYDADGVLKQESVHTSAGTDVITHKKDGSTKLWDAKLADLSFEYDSQGNWTKRSHRRKIIESNKTTEVVEVTYRKITYH
jgi:YD repeat-containing protein